MWGGHGVQLGRVETRYQYDCAKLREGEESSGRGLASRMKIRYQYEASCQGVGRGRYLIAERHEAAEQGTLGVLLDTAFPKRHNACSAPLLEVSAWSSQQKI